MRSDLNGGTIFRYRNALVRIVRNRGAYAEVETVASFLNYAGVRRYLAVPLDELKRLWR